MDSRQHTSVLEMRTLKFAGLDNHINWVFQNSKRDISKELNKTGMKRRKMGFHIEAFEKCCTF
jgi:hypothetical protein